MPRDLPIGNGQLLINFDSDYRIRDIYYPFVGKENHAGGHPFRFGVMVDGKFRWVSRSAGWELQLQYEPDTLVTHVLMTHAELGVQLNVRDCFAKSTSSIATPPPVRCAYFSTRTFASLSQRLATPPRLTRAITPWSTTKASATS